MPCKVLDPGLSAALLGNVIVGRYPPAVRQGLMDDGDCPSIRHFNDKRHGFAFRDHCDPNRNERVASANRMVAGCKSLTKNVLKKHSGLNLLARNSVHLRVSAIRYDKALIAIEHAQALRHVVERGLEPEILFFELLGLRDLGGDVL